MLGHPHPDCRDVEHLPGLDPALGGTGQPRTAPQAADRFIPLALIRLCDLRQRRTRVAFLPARPTTTAAPQRLRCRLGRPITGRRLGGVRGVLPHLRLQLGHLGPQQLHQHPKLRILRRQLLIRRLRLGGHPTMIDTTNGKIKSDTEHQAGDQLRPQIPE